MTRRTTLVLLAALAASCRGRTGTDARLEHPAAEVSDTAIAQSKLPGASGVRKALEAQDSANARRALEDTLTP